MKTEFLLPCLLTTLTACGGDEVQSQDSGAPLALSQVRFWAYQIQEQYDNPQALADSRYDLLVIDQVRSISDFQTYDDKGLVSKLKASANHKGGNKLVVAYIDVGEAEDYRWYWKSGWKVGNPSFIVSTDPDGWTGNYPVAFWDPAWKAIVFQFLDRILEDGFDGIYMDWLEGYVHEPVAKAAAGQGKNAVTEMVAFVKEISKYVKSKKPGFLVIGQNAAELGAHADYLSAVDAQAQEHVWFRGQTGGAPGDLPMTADDTKDYQQNLALFLKAGKPVFTVDYATMPANVKAAYDKAKEKGYVEYVTTVELDRLTSTPPPGYSP